MALPSLMVVKSNYSHKYLRYIHEDGEVHGLLQFSGEEIVSPYAKFAVEAAKYGQGLVHIRCCYNNKYWQRSSEDNLWIAAVGDQPEEDKCKWSCTLFEPLYVEAASTVTDAKTVRFRHVQLGNYACLWRAAAPYESCLCAAAPTVDGDSCDVYTIVNWQSLLILPKRVAFKGCNGNFLTSSWIEDHPYLASTCSDIGDITVGNEVITTGDGSVRIKSDYHGRFWRRSPNWIWADNASNSTEDSDTLFWPIKVDSSNVIALRNLGNKNFCKLLTTEGKTYCLNAAVSTITNEARLEVHETVFSRRIYNCNYRLTDARIYGKTLLTMATGEAINYNDEPSSFSTKLSYTKTKSSTWNYSVSLKLGVKTTFETGIPYILDAKLELSAEVTGTVGWGDTETSTTTVETVYNVTVPPKTKVTVSALATQGTCDVPFSYSQTDNLPDGTSITYNKNDGVYTGINSYNFRYETKEEKL
ncbi:hypothetical protein RHGRI_012176 [Rhododendron griersonianum]|uniref:Agglutinin domain-containing protein n=1 Tax=Rhododendron griersonianum TaxID=479676 RepID=A0AAV6KQJ7_9ERIC|nr:hypothetical protein RHGRI_012176 [Rhododendron griersonianum]